MRRAGPLAIALGLLLAAAWVRPAPGTGGPAPTAVALGGLSPLLVDYLWLRAAQQQDAGRYFEMLQTARWIAALEPRLGSLHRFQAWQLATDVANQFPAPADRWRWIAKGLSVYFDTALTVAGEDPLVAGGLAELLLARVADAPDAAGEHGRRAWAELWDRLLGGPGLAGLDPRPLARDWRLDLVRMQRLDADYGPFDWRAAPSHAFYWALRGEELAGAGGRGALVFRSRYQALRGALLDGRVVLARGVFCTVPHVALLRGCRRSWDELARRHPNDAGVRLGKERFAREELVLLTAFGREAEARGLAGPGYEQQLARAVRAELLGDDPANSPAVAASFAARARLCAQAGERNLVAPLENLARLARAAAQGR
jgi:hypothetical protein